MKMARFSDNKIVCIHKDKPEWFACKHFHSVDKMIKYYETLGGITFINRTIVCEDCYEKILARGWKDISAARHVLDAKSFREIFGNIAFLNAKKTHLD